MHVLTQSALFLFFASADSQPPKKNDIEMQRFLMEKLFEVKQYSLEYVPLEGYYLIMGGIQDDYCNWKAIECHNGLITSISARQHGDWAVCMEWMPPTVECIHFNGINTVQGWGAENLPRNLRYLYLNGCSTRRSKAKYAFIHLHKLPERMEELIVLRDKHHAGQIRLHALPAAMRLLYIAWSYRSPHPIVVNHQFLPATMQHLFMTYPANPGKIKIKEVGESACEVSTVFTYMSPNVRSKHFAVFEKKLESNDKFFPKQRKGFDMPI